MKAYLRCRMSAGAVRLLAIGFALLWNCKLAAQGVEYIKSHYTKYEYRIPMRDGKKLFTAVYLPKDDSQSYPIMLFRSPYSVWAFGADQYIGKLGPSPLFAQEAYSFAYQDVRCLWMSEVVPLVVCVKKSTR